MIKQIELLVHAGAPSGRKDDDKYKAQAVAYFGFQGRRISSDEGLQYQPAISPEYSEQHGAEHQDETTVIESPTIFLDDTQLAITGLESQLLTSSLPIASGRIIESSDVSQSSVRSAHSSLHGEEVFEGIGPVSKDDLLAQIRSFGKRRRDGDLEDPSSSGPHLNGNDFGDANAASANGSEDRDARSSTALSLSSYLKTPILDRSTKKRRLDQDDVSHFPRAASSAYVTHPNSSQKGVAYIGGQQTPTTNALHVPAATAPAAVTRLQGSLAISEPTSELPTSYSLSDITSESSRARVRVSQRSASDPGSGGRAVQSPAAHVDTSTASGSNDSRITPGPRVAQSSTSPAQKVQAAPEVVVIPDDTPTDDVPAVVRVKNTGIDIVGDGCKAVGAKPPAEQSRIIQPNSTAPTAAFTEASITLHTLSTTIHPPEPEVSIDCWKTHITPALANLASNENMAGRYSPASTSRDIRCSERGHWLFDTSSWNPEIQVHFWQFLEKAVGGGSLGWGVWCTREVRETGYVGGVGSQELGIVKAYCWGEVVKHMYLLLYVASKSQMRKVGARWVDAEGNVVVQMRKAG